MEEDGNTQATPTEKPTLTEKDNSGLKYFDQIAPLLKRLHEGGCERDKAVEYGILAGRHDGDKVRCLEHHVLSWPTQQKLRSSLNLRTIHKLSVIIRVTTESQITTGRFDESRHRSSCL